MPADRVVLALGNFPPSDPDVADRSFYQSQRYISHPWAPEALDHLAPTAPVLLVGSGLTMMDLVLALKARGHQGIDSCHLQAWVVAAKPSGLVRLIRRS